METQTQGGTDRHMHRRRDGCSRVEVEAVSRLPFWLGGQLRRTESERTALVLVPGGPSDHETTK